jgi:phage tail-like protein
MAIVHPMPSYHFTVQWGGARIGFQEISGLNIQADIVEFRDGADPESHPRKMPGQLHYSNIVLKRGIVPSDNEFFAWIDSTQCRRAADQSSAHAGHDLENQKRVSGALLRSGVIGQCQ